MLDALDAAAGVLASLEGSGHSLRLAVADGAIVGELRDAGGSVVRTIPPRQLVDVLSGVGRGVSFDAEG